MPRSRASRLGLALSERAPARTRQALGVVFCGGSSRRMGRDKAVLGLGGRSLLERSVETLSAACPRVVLASGASPRYETLGLECLCDEQPGSGPLGGLAAALAHLEAQGLAWACVLACDMPAVPARVFHALLARARETRAEVTLLATASGLEPLCGVYHARALPAVRAALARGERRMDSFHAAVRVETLAEGEIAPGCALNLNTPEEYRAAGGPA